MNLAGRLAPPTRGGAHRVSNLYELPPRARLALGIPALLGRLGINPTVGGHLYEITLTAIEAAGRPIAPTPPTSDNNTGIAAMAVVQIAQAWSRGHLWRLGGLRPQGRRW
jgi:hypothetical protein